MNDTIKDMFQEKNSKILRDKLLLDINNNIDSLKITIDNHMMLLLEKYLKKISTLFNELDIEYTISELDDLLKKNKEDIRKKVFELLEEKIEYVKNSETETESKDDLTLFQEKIDASTETFKVKFKSTLNEEIYINLKESILLKSKISSEDDLVSLSQLLNDYDNRMYSDTIDFIYYRDISLKNTTNATYERYVDMQSVSDKLPKIKIKESD